MTLSPLLLTTNTPFFSPSPPPLLHSQPPLLRRRVSLSLPLSTKETHRSVPRLFSYTTSFIRNRVRGFYPQNAGNSEASSSGDIPNGHDNGTDEILGDWRTETSISNSPFLVTLAVALGIAATITILSVWFNWHCQGSITGAPILVYGSSATLPVNLTGFTLKIFGHQVILSAYAPGWIYFWLLMAAGCGLFVSEEALNIWVGISLARMLTLDGTWVSFVESFSRNATYIISTVLWVYWGVCISDMVPFYFGKLFRQTGASDDVCSKLGIEKEKAINITRAVQRYGNLVGVVERFSLGVRNPTAFLAGSLGISPECFFAGVCLGGLITLPIQLGIGFLLRECPVVAVASVATVVGIWTVFPYAMAALTALFLYIRSLYSK